MTETSLSFLLLAGGLVPLAAAPLLARLADRSESTKAMMDAFVAVALGGIVVLHLWPHAFLSAGVWALMGGLAGLLLPFLMHGSFRSREQQIYPALVALAFLGLAVHAILDGMALFAPVMTEAEHAAGGHGHGHGHDHAGEGSAALLAIAVVLHRLPMGLAIWWMALPVLGMRVAVGLLASIGAATVIGFGAADLFLMDLSSPALAVFEATVAGMLLHVVLGHDHDHAGHDHSGHDCSGGGHRHDVPWASALGALVGVGFLVLLFVLYPMERQAIEALSFGASFVALCTRVAPGLLGGLVLHRVLRLLLAPKTRQQSAEGEDFDPDSGIDLGAVLATRPAFYAFPAVGVAHGLLGWEWAVMVAAIAGWVLTMAEEPAEEESRQPKNGAGNPMAPEALVRAVHRGVIWALLGILAVSIAEPTIHFESSLPLWILAPAAALLGLFLARNTLFAIFPAFFFLHLGGEAWPVVVFLYLGAWASVFRRDDSPFGDRLFSMSFVLLLAGFGVLVAMANEPRLMTHWELHGSPDEPVSPRQWASLAILALVASISLFRLGFRGFLGPISKAVDEPP